jgi:4-diphosphocytidyl-2-C-methyl-D-erythritol kinase
MASGAPASYLASDEAEARLAAWLDQPAALGEALLYNNMEGPAFAKYIVLPVLVDRLREEFNLRVCMSGSGSACFAFLPENAPVAFITSRIRELLGPQAFVTETWLS